MKINKEKLESNFINALLLVLSIIAFVAIACLACSNIHSLFNEKNVFNGLLDIFNTYLCYVFGRFMIGAIGYSIKEITTN